MPSSTSPPPHDPTPSSARSLSPPFSLHVKHDDLFPYAADHGSRTGRVSPPNLHELSGEALFGRSPLSPTSPPPPASSPVDYTAQTTMHEPALPVTDSAFVQREREARKKLRERYMVSLSGNEKLEKMLQILQEGVEYAAMVKGEKGRGGSGEEPRWKADGEKSIRERGRADPAANQNKTASPSKQAARGESPSSSPSRRHRPKLPPVDSVKAQRTPPLTPPATTSLLDSPAQSITSSHCTKRRENSTTKVASDPRTPNGDMTREHERFFTASEGGDASGERAARPHSSNSPRSSTFRSPGQFHVDAFGSPKLGTTRSPPPSPAYLDSRSPRSENFCSPLHSPPPFSPPYKSRPTSPTSPGTAALANPRSLTPMPSLPSSPPALDKARPALFRTLGYDFLPSRSMSRTHGVDDELTEEEKQWAELSRKVRDDGRGRDWWGMPIGFGGNWGKSILSPIVTETEPTHTSPALSSARSSFNSPGPPRSSHPSVCSPASSPPKLQPSQIDALPRSLLAQRLESDAQPGTSRSSSGRYFSAPYVVPPSAIGTSDGSLTARALELASTSPSDTGTDRTADLKRWVKGALAALEPGGGLGSGIPPVKEQERGAGNQRAESTPPSAVSGRRSSLQHDHRSPESRLELDGEGGQLSLDSLRLDSLLLNSPRHRQPSLTSPSGPAWRAPTSSSSDSVLSEERCHERRARGAKESEKLTQIEENIRDSFVQAELEMPDYESFISGSNGVRRSLGSMQNDAFSPPPPRPGQPLKPYRRGPFPVPELTEAEKEERRRKRKLGISPEIDAAPGESKAELRKRAWEEWLLFDQEKQRLVAQLSHEASPNDAQVYNALAKLHLRAPIPSAREFAEQLLVQSLQIDEGQPEIASLLARCIEGRDPKEAIRCRIALRYDPHSPDHHLNLATALQRASSPNSAADAYAGLARGFVDSPWEPIALFRLGQLAEDPHGLNDRLRAADAFEKALESLKRLSLLAPSLAEPGPWEALDELERMLLDALDGLRAAPNEHTSRSIDIYNETSLTLDHILAGLQHMSRSTAAAELAESSRRLAQQVDRSFERMRKAAEDDTLRQNALLKSLEDLSKELTTLPERLVSTARLMAKRPPHVAPPPPPPDPIEILLRKLEQARQLSRST
ncbi:hypothetical protein JCM1841_000805 [Sporobolomyces salmonicolor]